MRKEARDKLDGLKAQLGKVILGKPDIIHRLVVALVSGSHVLMEDLPGVGKTTLAKALARSIAGDFKRAQFTPDLLPTDILGSSVYNPMGGSFAFKPGPIFTHVLLADEINRASPRTQSALLEAMSEDGLDRMGRRRCDGGDPASRASRLEESRGNPRKPGGKEAAFHLCPDMSRGQTSSVRAFHEPPRDRRGESRG